MKTITIIGLFLIMFIVSCSNTAPLVVSRTPEQPVYLRKHSPGPEYTWREGEWIVRNGTYRWKKGDWVKPQHRDWVMGSWQPRGNGWYWSPGHWENKNYVSINPEIIFQ